MQSSLGHTIVTKHGLISNVLIALPFEAQLILACLMRRTYEITVPCNVPIVKNKDDDITISLECKKVYVSIIEGENKTFCGIAHETKGNPEKFG
jgi:hypothetical protein